MKTLLIVFAILLFLLVCLSAFGGTISYSEPFYETSAVYNAPQDSYNYTLPPQQLDEPVMQPPMQQFDDQQFVDQQAIGQQTNEQFYGKPRKEKFTTYSEGVDSEFMIEPFETHHHTSMPASY